jgi:hypothetical protein
MTTPTFDVSFTKYVNILENVDVNKDVNAHVFIKGNLADANATADAIGHNTLAQTLTETHTVEGYGSSASSESLSASTKAYDFHIW